MGTYSLQFKCGNCGKRWTKNIETGKKVVHKRTRGEVVIRPEGPTSLSDIEKVECPKCETKSKVKPIRSRNFQKAK